MYKYLVHLNCRFHHRVVRTQMFLVRKLSLTTQVVSGRFLLLVSLSGLSLSMGRVIIVVSRSSSSPHPSSHLLQQSLPAPRCEATLMTSVTRTLLGHWDTGSWSVSKSLLELNFDLYFAFTRNDYEK